MNEDAPIFTSPDSVSVAENRTVAYTAMATDADGDSLRYSLSGTDAGSVHDQRDDGRGQLYNPTRLRKSGRHRRNNVYNITVTASDGDNRNRHHGDECQ